MVTRFSFLASDDKHLFKRPHPSTCMSLIARRGALARAVDGGTTHWIRALPMCTKKKHRRETRPDRSTTGWQKRYVFVFSDMFRQGQITTSGARPGCGLGRRHKKKTGHGAGSPGQRQRRGFHAMWRQGQPRNDSLFYPGGVDREALSMPGRRATPEMGGCPPP